MKLCWANALDRRSVLALRYKLGIQYQQLVELSNANGNAANGEVFEATIGVLKAALTESLCAFGGGCELEKEQTRLKKEIKRCEKRVRRKNKRICPLHAVNSVLTSDGKAQRESQRSEAVLEDAAFENTLKIRVDLKAQCKKLLVLKVTLEAAVTFELIPTVL